MSIRRFDAVIFDVGGVLIDCNPRYLYSEYFDDQKEMEFFLEEICNDEWNRLQDRGRNIVEATRELGAAYPHFSTFIDMFYSQFDQMIKGAVLGMTELVEELISANIPLYALTNWPDATFPKAIDRLPLLNKFQGIVTSASVGLLKPEPEIFEVAISKFGVDRERTLFVDDHGPNVQGARSAGLAAALFTDAPSLRHMLTAHGVL